MSDLNDTLRKKSELLIRLGALLDRLRVCQKQNWNIHEEVIGLAKVVRDLVEMIGKE